MLIGFHCSKSVKQSVLHRHRTRNLAEFSIQRTTQPNECSRACTQILPAAVIRKPMAFLPNSRTRLVVHQKKGSRSMTYVTGAAPSCAAVAQGECRQYFTQSFPLSCPSSKQVTLRSSSLLMHDDQTSRPTVGALAILRSTPLVNRSNIPAGHEASKPNRCTVAIYETAELPP